MGRAAKVVVNALVLVGGLYAAWGALLFATQRRIVFSGALRESGPPPALETGETIIPLPVDREGAVEAIYLPGAGRHARSPGPLLMFTHGNGELVDDWLPAFRSFARKGVGVVLVEFPGYGRSAGRPGEASVVRATVQAYDAVVGRPEVDGGAVVAMGRSLGGGAAAALTRRRPVAALVLQSSFTSLRPFARRYLLPGWLVRDPFDNASALAAFDGPVLVFHGRRDAVIPHRHGEALAAAAPRGRLVSWDCGHNDCPPDWEAFVDEITAFLAHHDLIGAGADGAEDRG